MTRSILLWISLIFIAGCSKLNMQWSTLLLAPANLTVTTGNTLLTVSWPSSERAQSYTLYWATEPTVTLNSTKIENVTSPYLHTGLSNGQTYYYTVVSIDASGHSPLSIEKNSTPFPEPTGLTSTLGNQQISLTWTNSRDVTSYNLYWNNTGNVTVADNKITNVTSPYTHTSLTNGNSYFYVLTAVYNGSKEGPPSTEISNIATSRTFYSIPQNTLGYKEFPSKITLAVKEEGSKLYVGTERGLAISTDGGVTFQTRTMANGLGSNNIFDVVVNGDSVYAATAYGPSISTDRGTSFTNTALSTNATDYRVWSIAYLASKIFVGTETGLFLTTDNGVSYTNKNSIENNGIFANSTGVYSATTVQGLLVSRDEGSTFSTSSLTGNTNWVVGNGSNIYVAKPAVGFAISNDSGATFNLKTTANGMLSNNIWTAFVDGSTAYPAGPSGLSFTSDNGATFTNKANATNGLGTGVGGVYANASKVYAATNTGLSTSTNGGSSFTTQLHQSGLPVNSILSLFVSGSNIYVGTYVGLAISTDGGKTFSTKTAAANSLASDYINDVFVTSAGVIFAGTNNGLSKSIDGGTTFTSVSFTNTIVRAVFVDSTTGIIYAGTNSSTTTSADGGLFYSSDSSGTSYAKKNNNDGLASNIINGIHVYNNTIYVATSLGISQGPTNFSTNFTSPVIPRVATNAYKVFVANNTIYAAANVGLIISTDGLVGTNYIRKTTSDGLPSNTVHSVFADALGIYAATEKGLAVSFDGGSTFLPYTSSYGLPSQNVFRVYGSGSDLYVGSNSSYYGLFKGIVTP